MQFIRLAKLTDIAERVLPKPVLDWIDAKSVQNINIIFVQNLRAKRLIS